MDRKPAWDGEPGQELRVDLDDLLDLQERAAIIERAVLEADAAWEGGDHVAVVEHLTPLLDDEVTWSLVRHLDSGGIAVTLAYQGGISRLQCGDPDGAAAWLSLVVDDPDVTPEVRRGLAQIELTRGDFEAVDRLLDTGEGASAMDLAIATLAAGYRGDHDRVMELGAAAFEATTPSPEDDHPWDLAGRNVLIGQALVEVGEAERAMVSANNALDLISGAPRELPLIPQAWTLAAGAYRLHGDLDGAAAALNEAWDLLLVDTCDRGMAEREAARCYRQAGNEPSARNGYAAAVASFQAAGERFLAEATEREAAQGA
jgi:hypothetical protein